MNQGKACLNRRASYPAKPEPDTLALAEHYRLRWRQARMLRALAFGIKCTRADLMAVSGIPAKYIGQILSIMDRRLRIRIEGFSFECGHATAWCIANREDVETLQAIIAASWWQDQARAA